MHPATTSIACPVLLRPIIPVRCHRKCLPYLSSTGCPLNNCLCPRSSISCASGCPRIKGPHRRSPAPVMQWTSSAKCWPCGSKLLLRQPAPPPAPPPTVLMILWQTARPSTRSPSRPQFCLAQLGPLGPMCHLLQIPPRCGLWLSRIGGCTCDSPRYHVPGLTIAAFVPYCIACGGNPPLDFLLMQAIAHPDWCRYSF